MKLSEANVEASPPFRLSLSAYYDGGENALIRIRASDDPTTEHAPSVFVLTIDESGSMAEAAVRHDDSDGASGLSQLDVVKHAARTIVETLSDHDRLAIVAFSDSARVVMPLAIMTEENKKITTAKIEDLSPLCSTNLYDGLHTALELVRTQAPNAANANVMLLTDGLPNVRPPRGELATLQTYLDAHPELRSVKISTFGFGYQLMSRLLSDIAHEGGSIYAFIPDSTFVGTIFINSVSNLLSTAAPRGATLKLEANDGVQIIGCSTGQKCSKTSWGMSVVIPTILYGQSVDVIVQVNAICVEPFRVTLEMGGLDHPLVAQTETIDPLDAEDEVMKQAAVRSAIIGFIKDAEIEKDLSARTGADLQRAQDLLELTKMKVAELADGVESTSITAMRKDLDGQITEAYSTNAFYQKWGSHYVLSLAGAHTLQQCINFKDPGIQQYATGKFCVIRDASEAIFLKMKPPKPSRKSTAPVQSMRVYYRASAPCFAAGAVTLACGETKQVSEVVAGDCVKSSGGHACVRCVVEIPSRDGIENLVELDGGVLVTPWHPVRVAGKGSHWVFPCFLAVANPRPCASVFSFVLEGDVSMQIGPYDGIALGHGINGDPVLEHDYLGTKSVLSDLSMMDGWAEGRVRLCPDPAIRSGPGGNIAGFRQERERKKKPETLEDNLKSGQTKEILVAN